MKEKLVGQMDGEEFDSLLERFIETQSGPDEPLPGEVFVDLWAGIEEGRAPIEFNGMVVEGRLQKADEVLAESRRIRKDIAASDY